MQERAWSAAYGKQYTHVLGVAGTSEDDINPDGNESTPRTLRIYNSGANPMFFALTSKQGTAISASLPGVPLGAGHVIYVNVESNQRYLEAQSALGTTFYATPGVAGLGGGN